MDPPPVQYLRTRDGKNIAYAVCGQGEPLVFVPALFGHVNLGWDLYPSWFRALASRFRFLHYDGRGSGLSSRNLDVSHSVADWQSDLEAVMDAAGFQQAVLFAGCHAGHVAVRYALLYPDRVKALILNMVSVNQTAWGPAFWTTVSAENWSFFISAVAPRSVPPAERRRLADAIGESMTPADVNVSTNCIFDSTIESELPRLRTPTLVLHARDAEILAKEESAAVAAAIPNARFVLIDGDFLYGNGDQGIAAMDSFLADLPQAGSPLATPAYAPDRLSDRQIEVLRLLGLGRTNRQIAESLVLSERTVERHVADIYARIGVANRAQAAVYAQQHGIV